MTRRILIILTTFIPALLNGQDCTGYYANKGHDLGFFKTKFAIYADSTFYYSFSGDLQFEERKGKYTVNKKVITIQLKTDIDTIHLHYSEMDLGSIDTTDLPMLEPIIWDKNENIITKYYIKRNKIIPISRDDKKIRSGALFKMEEEDWENIRGTGIIKNTSR